MKKSVSKTENIVLKKIEKIFRIKIKRQFPLEGKFYDGKYKNYLLEIDGLYWHSTQEQKMNDSLKDVIAKKNGYKIIRIVIPSMKSINNQIFSKYKLLSEMVHG